MLRSPSDIGCAHCTSLTGDRACPTCTRIICATCASDWLTCKAPVGRSIDLGPASLVHDIDPDGRIAVVAQRGKVRALDLRMLKFQAIKGLNRGMFTEGQPIAPRLTSRRTLVYADLDQIRRNLYYRGLTALALDTGKASAIDTRVDIIPASALVISATGDRIGYFSAKDEIHVATAGAAPRVYASRMRTHVRSVCIDAVRGYVGTGGRGEIALDHMTADKVFAGGHATLEPPGDVFWVDIADNVLVAAIRDERETRIELRRIGGDLSIGDVVHSHSHSNRLGAAALARDGRALAFAFAHQLFVLNTESGHVQTFGEEGSLIYALRFTDGHALIAADSGNQLTVRPRTEGGYDVPLRPAEV